MVKKILVPLIVLALLWGVKYLLWNYSISSGKLVGNLSKISKQGRVFKTWEGVLEEDNHENLSTRFSVRDEKLAQELYTFEGKSVILYYEEHVVGFPSETKIVVTSWRKKKELPDETSPENTAIEKLNLTLFCSFIGTLYNDRELYVKIKNLMKQKNLFLYKQYEKCNN